MEKSKIRWQLILLIIMQICVVLLLHFGLLITGISLMAFDSGYSTEAAIFVFATWVYPVIALIRCLISWIFYARSKFKSSVHFNGYTSYLSGFVLLCFVLWGVANLTGELTLQFKPNTLKNINKSSRILLHYPF